MKITLAPSEPQFAMPEGHRHRTVCIESESDDLDMEDVGELIRSALLAWGFAEKTVDEYLPPQ